MPETIELYKMTVWPLGVGEDDGGQYPEVIHFDSRHTAISYTLDNLRDWLRNHLLMVTLNEPDEGKRDSAFASLILEYTSPMEDLEWARYEDFPFRADPTDSNKEGEEGFEFQTNADAIFVSMVEIEVGSGQEYRTDWGSTEHA